MKIKANRLDRGYFEYQSEFEAQALKVLRSGWYVLGEEVKVFEKQFAEYIGVKYCVGLGSGLDALWLAVKALGIGSGDEVIIQANTYIAGVMGITINGATPVFVEPDEFYNINVEEIEAQITKKTKAILVVHLYGQASNMSRLVQLAKAYGLKIIEDCAQSHGAKFDGKTTGSFGDIGCFSFYPSKNIGAFGEAGAIVTNNKKLAESIQILRNYGSEKRYYNRTIGTNSRLDELQAALLQVRLRHISECIEERERICNKYLNEITNPLLHLPCVRDKATSVWHQFVIRIDERQKLQKYLEEKEIGTIIHYPIPPYLSEAYKYLGIKKGSFPVTENYALQVLSLPLYNGMTELEQDYVIDNLNKYRR